MGICVSACTVLAEDSDVQALEGRIEIEHRADHFKATAFLANPTATAIEFACGRGNVAKSNEFAFSFGCGSMGVTPARFTPVPRQSAAPIICVVPAGEEILYDEYFIGYPDSFGPGTYPLMVRFAPMGKLIVHVETQLNVPKGVSNDTLRRRSSNPRAENELLCRVLGPRYLRPKKDNWGIQQAAIHLISVLARGCEYWRVILEDWRHGDPRNERYNVDVIGRMLADDAIGRDFKELPPEKQRLVAMLPGIVLDDSVLPELVARALQADGSIVDHYILAAARARDRRAIDFLARVLSDTQPRHAASTKFHASVGLANLADSRGVEWLIDHVDDEGPTVTLARPPGAGRGNLDECCLWTLRYLSGKPALTTQAEWREWWSTVRQGFTPTARVTLLDG